MQPTDTKPRDAYHHRDLRAALIRTATEMMRQEGPDRLSLRALAHQLNVSHAAVYRHFAHKEALLVQVAIAGFSRLVRALQRAGRPGDGPQPVLVRCAMAYVRFGLRNPGLYDLLFSPIVQRDPESKPHADHALAVVAEIITAARAASGGRPPGSPADPLDLARSAWALSHGLVDLNRREQLGHTTEREILRRAETLLRAMLESIAD